jgi:anti-sigma factor RsiW
MRKMNCESLLELLPDLAAGRLDGDRVSVAEAHMADCPDCRETLATLRLLSAATPQVPGDVETRIRQAVAGQAAPIPAAPAQDRVRGVRPFWRRPAPAWGLAAAAVLALLLGRTVMPDDPGDLEILALGQDDVPALLPDDGMVAGGPVLDDLSDEDLALLLEELDR